VIAFGFRPEPGLAPPRPIPLDFVIFKPKMMQREIVSPLVWGSRARVRGRHENFMRTRASPAYQHLPGRGLRKIQLNGPSRLSSSG
jgi:hypothetical protein